MRADRLELRVLDSDPHAQAIPWPGPSARSITRPMDLGSFEDAEPCRVLFLRRHALFAGTTGSGKSGGLNVLMATLAASDDVVIWAIDLKKGIELKPWAPCIDWLATTREEASALLADAAAILQARDLVRPAAAPRTKLEGPGQEPAVSSAVVMSWIACCSAGLMPCPPSRWASATLLATVSTKRR